MFRFGMWNKSGVTRNFNEEPFKQQIPEYVVYLEDEYKFLVRGNQEIQNIILSGATIDVTSSASVSLDHRIHEEARVYVPDLPESGRQGDPFWELQRDEDQLHELDLLLRRHGQHSLADRSEGGYRLLRSDNSDERRDGGYRVRDVMKDFWTQMAPDDTVKNWKDFNSKTDLKKPNDEVTYRAKTRHLLSKISLLEEILKAKVEKDVYEAFQHMQGGGHGSGSLGDRGKTLHHFGTLRDFMLLCLKSNTAGT